MPTKVAWPGLSHEQRVKVLTDKTIDQILNDYEVPGQGPEDFRTSLVREVALWKPKNLGKFATRGGPPTKDVVLGAWRDLDRSEAILELIDNSIDAWSLRRAAHPAATPEHLNIHIKIDAPIQQLIYEDNAGGVPPEKLAYLVVPGYSDTTDLTATIGSYKTGGKKAIFRLATAASITTRYLNPAETTDEAWSIQLDDVWLRDPRVYEFPCAPLKDKSAIEKGQTRYAFQLREEPLGGVPWYLDAEHLESVLEAIQRAYTLLLIRNPNIRIYFYNQDTPVKPLDGLYDFSGTNKDGTDLRPRQVKFEFEMLHEGVPHKIAAEVVLGCRRTTGGGDTLGAPGIDLYGNDRLFVLHEQETFAHLLPGGGARNLVRGFINIHGPNVFIPWDTHKRHLNPDREIMRVLTKNKLITDFFDAWYETYQAVGRGDVTALITEPLPKVVDTPRKDLFIPIREVVKVDVKKKRGVNLPKTLSLPRISTTDKAKDSLTVKFSVTIAEAAYLQGMYGVMGSPSKAQKKVESELSDAIREDVLGRAKKRRKK